MPDLETAYTKYHDHGFEIIGINMDINIDLEVFRTFLKAHNSTWVHTATWMHPEGAALKTYIDSRLRVVSCRVVSCRVVSCRVVS